MIKHIQVKTNDEIVLYHISIYLIITINSEFLILALHNVACLRL